MKTLSILLAIALLVGCNSPKAPVAPAKTHEFVPTFEDGYPKIVYNDCTKKYAVQTNTVYDGTRGYLGIENGYYQMDVNLSLEAKFSTKDSAVQASDSLKNIFLRIAKMKQHSDSVFNCLNQYKEVSDSDWMSNGPEPLQPQQRFIIKAKPNHSYKQVK